MHFVDNVNFVSCARRSITRPVNNFADIVDACTRRRIHLLHIDVTGFRNGAARLALTARIDGRFGAAAVRADTVQRPRDDACGGRLADAANTGKHKGVCNTAGSEGVAQCPDESFLANQTGEILRPVFTSQYPIIFDARPRAWRRIAQAQARLTAVVQSGLLDPVPVAAEISPECEF